MCSLIGSCLLLQHSYCDLNLIVACTKDRIGELNVCVQIQCMHIINVLDGLRGGLSKELMLETFLWLRAFPIGYSSVVIYAGVSSVLW